MDRKYLVQFGGAMAGYAVVLLVCVSAIVVSPDAWWRFLVVLLPLVPLVFAMRAFTGALRRMDELQRRIQFEAIGFAFGGTALLTFAYGFMQLVDFPQVSWLFVWPVMAVLWMIGLVLARQRYG